MSLIINERPAAPVPRTRTRTRTDPHSSNTNRESAIAIGVRPLEALKLNDGITDAEKETKPGEKGVIMAWVGYGNFLRFERVSKVYVKIYICTPPPPSPSSPSSLSSLSSPSPSSSSSELYDLSATADLLLSILKKGYGGSYYERQDRVARRLAWEVEELKGVRERFGGFGYVRFESRREFGEAVRRGGEDGGRCVGWD
ncbi:hypothetical protein B9479_005577 [Cryptococcus floricola]|uniref:Uncharacterized protein n=1 Tax=Cryptococcus floricola TaxID=2591691 RepID=A0A5D3AVH8_9TREE|nr:hypothetical protein B9479_005577 [Cryptococcus floricola]